jgi:G6PDH family F420-dependent oxidoreductase
MFPGRFWAALGTGEASNEHITGQPWPRKELRNQRLGECVDIIRALHRGEEVSHDGLVTVDRARLWTLPAEAPPLIGAAVSEKTARWVAGWADGMVTVNQPPESLKRVIAAYREAGGTGPVALQIHLSWAPSQQDAEQIAYDQWRSNVFAPPVCWDLETVELFDEACKHVTAEDVAKSVYVSHDTGQHAEWLHDLAGLGFDELYLHHVGQELLPWLDAFGTDVLPQLEVTPR